MSGDIQEGEEDMIGLLKKTLLVALLGAALCAFGCKMSGTSSSSGSSWGDDTMNQIQAEK